MIAGIIIAIVFGLVSLAVSILAYMEARKSRKTTLKYVYTEDGKGIIFYDEDGKEIILKSEKF